MIAPSNATKVSMARLVTDVGAAFSTATTTEVDQVSLEQNIGAKTKATASLANTSTDLAGAATQAQTTQFTVATGALPKVNIKGAFSQTDSSGGQSTTTNVNVQAKPADFLQIQANVLSAETNDSSGSSLQYQRNVNLIGTPTKFTRFTAMYSQTGVNDQDNVSKGAVMELTPLANTKVSAG